MILRGPIHDLEVELLLSIVLAIAETNVECYSTQWVVCALMSHRTSWKTPRGRYDEHNSKFSLSYDTKV
jgi:hypothetical protein